MHVRSSETEGNRAYAVSGGVMSSTRSFVWLFALALSGCGDDEQFAATCPGCGGASGGTAGSVATGASGGASGAAGSGGVSGTKCTEFRVDPSILPPTREWIVGPAPVIELPLHPFWRDAAGMHMAWGAIAGPVSEPLSIRELFVVSSFEATTGSPQEHTVYDVLPPNLPAANAWPIAAAGSPNGNVAFAYAYRESLQTDPSEHILLAKLDDPGKQLVWDAPWATSDYTLWEVAWDGEAFAVHVASFSDSSMQLIRLTPDGTLLSGPTLAGSSYIQPGTYSVETDSASGRTVFASEGAPGVWLSGHERDGTPLFPSDPNLGAGIEAVGVPNGGSSFVAAAADGNEVLLAWQNVNYDNYIQSVSGLQPDGPALVISKEESDSQGGFRARALSRTATGWTMAVRAYADVDAFEIENGALAPRRTLIRVAAPCVKTMSCQSWFSGLDARYLDLVRYQDELWLGFLDNSDGYTNPETHPVQLLAYRIVDARAPCLFDSLYDEHHPQ
jgi:hypothetical protein